MSNTLTLLSLRNDLKNDLLMIAAESLRIDDIKRLLLAGADPLKKSEVKNFLSVMYLCIQQGLVALLYFVQRGETVLHALMKALDIRILSNSMKVLIEDKLIQAAKLFIARGTDPWSPGLRGKTALDMGTEAVSTAVVEVWLRRRYFTHSDSFMNHLRRYATYAWWRVLYFL